MRGAVADNNAADPHFGDQGGIGTGAAHQQYLDMKSLEEMVASLNLDGRVPLNELIRISKDAIHKSSILMQQGQLDLALVEYLRASDVVINTIPKHPDFNYMNQHHPHWADQFSQLMRAINSQHSTMENIKRKVISDDSVSGSAERSQPRLSSQGYTASSNAASNSPFRENAQKPTEAPIHMPSPSSFQHPSSLRPGLQTKSGSPSRKTKPEVKPKPDSLTRKHVEDKITTGDPLAQRFAELRNPHRNRASVACETGGVIQDNGWISSSKGVFSHKPSPFSHSHSRSVLNQPTSRPLGPREMNISHVGPPALPPKVPISPVDASLPRFPSPAYSPITTIPAQPPSNPPRISTDSLRPTSYKQSTSWTGDSSDNFMADENPYRSRTPNGVHVDGDVKSKTADIVVGSSISAHVLLDYLRKYDILLIDVRSRDQYDSGHIYSNSIICIEPVALKENVSAEELEDRLVISPESEQSLFSRRNEFDLIVYYDQNTSDPSYLDGSPASSAVPHLRALYDTLYEFNMYKPLKDGRPPALLAGGLDAWVDLVGPQSLATTQTAAIMHSVRALKPVSGKYPPLRRIPTASANSSWEVRKRRLREFKPLNPEEERAWLEKAKIEEIDPATYGTNDGFITEEPEDIESSELEAVSPFVHTYEDFLRRFPEAHDISQSMTGAPTDQPPYAQLHIEPPIVPPSRPPPAVPRPSYSGVTDDRHIQPPLARQASATKHPLYKSSSPLDRIKLPRTGLVNLGSTCYMNSIIQSLSATTELTKFFFDNRFHTQVQKNWKGSHGVLPGLYANLVRSLWKNDVEVIRPTSFRKFIGRLNSEWAGSQQQDAKEFFDLLVDCLHEDLNLNWQRTPLCPLTTEQEMRREKMPIHQVSGIEWSRYCHRELSYISSLFAGQHASRLRCTTCRRTSTTYEAFYSISVEIPVTGTGDIYQCLRSYCQEEMLSGDEVWKCPHCRTEREATKRIILTRAPRFLVFHFKRFSASHQQQARKIHTPVYFPLSGLDMSSFMFQPPHTRPSSPEPNGNFTRVSATIQPQTELAPHDLATSSPYIYNAYAVVRHLGSTIHEGHYISMVRDTNRDCWRKFDDHRVTDFKPKSLRSPDCLQNEQAYLVFYERVPAN
ncbi:ubiquitin-specific protease doa4 [Emydomyces testavorans]|uniref:Ubiquitin-specific protease doa4 n=1 Tax=Emydomyces testavorans TaxID=2070801 RepID=A0AAF0IKS7_9EURO|nr:ubiquitin-specific protease doa4 [Emydomyces testavorans]